MYKCGKEEVVSIKVYSKVLNINKYEMKNFIEILYVNRKLFFINFPLLNVRKPGTVENIFTLILRWVLVFS